MSSFCEIQSAHTWEVKAIAYNVRSKMTKLPGCIVNPTRKYVRDRCKVGVKQGNGNL